MLLQRTKERNLLMKSPYHLHKLKYRIYKIERHLDKLSKRSKRQVKCLLRHWVCWWENVKEVIMPYKSKKQQKAYKASGGWKKSKPTGKGKSYTKKTKK